MSRCAISIRSPTSRFLRPPGTRATSARTSAEGSAMMTRLDDAFASTHSMTAWLGSGLTSSDTVCVSRAITCCSLPHARARRDERPASRLHRSRRVDQECRSRASAGAAVHRPQLWGARGPRLPSTGHFWRRGPAGMPSRLRLDLESFSSPSESLALLML
jgi:hypothetical protein